MAVRSWIGWRQVRSMKPGETDLGSIIDGVRRAPAKSDAVVYVLFYRTKEGRQRWFTIGKHGVRGRPKRRGRRQGAY